jgi:hypothetical protein
MSIVRAAADPDALELTFKLKIQLLRVTNELIDGMLSRNPDVLVVLERFELNFMYERSNCC